MNKTQKSFSSLAWRLGICLALIAGMFAWLAVPAQAAAPEKAVKTALSAVVCKRNLIVSGNGFEPNQMYQVTAQTRYSITPLDLGKIKATSRGRISGAMELNMVFRNTTGPVDLKVCVTSSATAKKTCTITKIKP